MPAWTLQATDLLWQSALAAIPLVLMVALACRLLPCRPATRHTLWLLVLLWFVVGPFLPNSPTARVGAVLSDAIVPADKPAAGAKPTFAERKIPPAAAGLPAIADASAAPGPPARATRGARPPEQGGADLSTPKPETPSSKTGPGSSCESPCTILQRSGSRQSARAEARGSLALQDCARSSGVECQNSADLTRRPEPTQPGDGDQRAGVDAQTRKRGADRRGPTASEAGPAISHSSMGKPEKTPEPYGEDADEACGPPSETTRARWVAAQPVPPMDCRVRLPRRRLARLADARSVPTATSPGRRG